jgi:ABC-2 type transport system permease protein
MSAVSRARVGALVSKEVADLRAGPGVLVPPLLMLVAAAGTPLAFMTLMSMPASDVLDSMRDAVAGTPLTSPWDDGLSRAGALQLFLLAQFLPILGLVPITGAMTLIATSVVAEKQARTLEPLLATPMTAAELLLAKALTAATVAVGLDAAGYALLLAGTSVIGEPRVAHVLTSPRALALVFALAPAVSFVALALGAIVSTRAKDARAAQQAGAFIVVPFVATFFSGLADWTRTPAAGLLLAAAGLVLLAAGLGLLAVRLFDRERMLTDWT